MPRSREGWHQGMSQPRPAAGSSTAGKIIPQASRRDQAGEPPAVQRVNDKPASRGTVRNCTPRLRDGSGDGRAGSGWFRCLDKGAATALRPDAVWVARAWLRAEIQRSVHARVSLQYHRTSPHAVPPSGTIWCCCKRIPQSQHETTAGRRAAKPPADGVRISSTMTASPPGDRRDPRSRPEDKQRPTRSRSWLDNRWLEC
jgi:hypothetical protein